MCGIFFCVCGPGSECGRDLAQCRELISRRGPDLVTELDTSLASGHRLLALSSVLWLQGASLQPQPVTDPDTGSILMWNGDIFKLKPGAETEDTSPAEVTEAESDTAALSRLLSRCSCPRDLVTLMSRVHGPWAMVYYHAPSATVWCGRDFFGRQSLLLSRAGGGLVLASCAPATLAHYTELPALGLYSCQLLDSGGLGRLQLHPWDCCRGDIDPSLLEAVDCDILNESIPCPVSNQSNLDCLVLENVSETDQLFPRLLQNPEVSAVVDQFEEVLAASVMTRLRHQPGLCKDCVSLSSAGWEECPHAAVGVLFSGGLDSCVLASLAASMTPADKPLHLYNVAFQQQDGGFSVPDRVTGLQAFQELRSLHPDKRLVLVLVDVTLEQLQRERAGRVRHLLHPLNTVLDDSIGCAIWFAARGRGHDRSNDT